MTNQRTRARLGPWAQVASATSRSAAQKGAKQHKHRSNLFAQLYPRQVHTYPYKRVPGERVRNADFARHVNT
eukprot:499892-Prorocentrum_minimum.AAC.1